MHVSSMGVSKLCFLFSLALCALLLLIPTLQPSQHQGDRPRPRAHNKPARHPGRLVVPLQTDMGKVTVGRNGIDGDSMGQSTPRETKRTVDGDWVYTARQTDTQGAGKHIDSQTGSEGDFLHRTGGVTGAGGSRRRNPLELKDIFIAVKTTRKYHKSRLDLLFQTWVSKAKEQVGGNTRRHTHTFCPQGRFVLYCYQVLQDTFLSFSLLKYHIEHVIN
nr:beta-1,3-N-acetylglucosaminyltransferase radical fringe-like [Oncorhynchus nerka]